jgi:steroid delta-isomerase-like uncharacterized protein
MTPGGLDQDFLEEFAPRWRAAWNAHDGEALAALCTEDVEYYDPALAVTTTGREPIVLIVQQFAPAFSDMRFTDPEPPYASLTAPKAIVPWRFTGTHDGEFAPMGLTATGARVEADGTDHWVFRDGLVCRHKAIYDFANVMRTLSNAAAGR